MPRVKRGVAAHKKHKKLLQMAEGHRGTRKRLFRPAHESVMRSMAYMYRDRRNRKRDMRRLWITRIHNPRISKLHDLYTTRGRKKSGLFLMEGPHLLEVLLNAGIAPREVYYQPGLLQRTASGRALLERLLHASGLSDNQLIEVS